MGTTVLKSDSACALCPLARLPGWTLVGHLLLRVSSSAMTYTLRPKYPLRYQHLRLLDG